MMDHPRNAFFQGRIVPFAEATVSVMNVTFNYGTGAFGGIRGYWNADEEQLFVFRVQDHFERLLQSGKILRMNITYTVEELAAILTDLLRTEGYRQNCYIRPLIYKSANEIGGGVRLHDIEDDLTIFALPSIRLHQQGGLHVCFSAWRRIDDNAIPARGKVTGAYVNSALIKSDAVLAGYDEALVLNNDGHVSEASVANLFIIRKGVAITAPVNANVLEGITRRTLIQLLREELNVEVIERDIDHTEIYLADEAFLCGTSAQVSPITRIEHRPIGDGQIGDITARLRDLYLDVVSGRVEKYREWLMPVYTSEAIQRG